MEALSPAGSWSSGDSASSGLLDFDADRAAGLLTMSILEGDLAQVQSLIEAGVSVAEHDTWVLYYACLEGLDMVQALLASPRIDFNIPVPELEGDTILHLILRTAPDHFRDCKKDIVKILIQNGVNPLQRDRHGDTALHILAGDVADGASGDTELLNYLLGDSGTISGDTGLGNIQMECRAHIDCQNDSPYQNTPLIVAVLYNHVACVRLLLEHGADPQILGEGGYSALDFATEREYAEAAGFLVSQMLKRGGKGEEAEARGGSIEISEGEKSPDISKGGDRQGLNGKR